MENANSDNKKSGLLIFMMVGLIALLTALGVTYYQSSRQVGDDSVNSAEAVDADQEPDEAAASENKKQSHKKTAVQKQESAQKKDSGNVLDKLKRGDIEVHGAKNPCTDTQRMMKQCSDY